jgi:hypothetical protein
MITTVLLVFWANGWAEIIDNEGVALHGRREATLGLGAVQSVDEVTRIASEQLRLYGRPRVEVSADIAPVGNDDRPYRGYLVGDVLNGIPGPTGPAAQRLTELTVSEDINGEVTYAPTMGDLILEAQEKFSEQLKKMANGTLEGSPAATPLSDVTVNSAVDCCPPAPPSPGEG